MNLIIPIFIVLLLAFGGIFLGLRAYKEDRSLTLSSNEVSPPKIIRIAAFYGASTCLIFFGIIMTGGILDANSTWSIKGALGAVLVSIVLGVIVAIGSAYQIYMSSRYKDALRTYLKKKNK